VSDGSLDAARVGLLHPRPSLVQQHRATVAGNLQFFLGWDYLNLIRGEVENFEAVCRCVPNVVAVLSDSSGEDEKVYPAEESNVCTDDLANRNGKDIECKGGTWLVGARTRFQYLHIAFAGRKREEATLMIEQILKFVHAQLVITQKIKEDARVEIAAASAHRDAAGGSEAHSRVDRYSVPEGAEACAITEMRKDRSFGKRRAQVMHE